VLRAGPLSDETIVRLANRRFVSFYFDLADSGAAGDPDARAFVVAARKELGGRQVPTPPVLFMTAEGRVLGEASNYATEAQVLEAMRAVLKAHPEYDALSDEEKALVDPVAIARLRMDLLDFEGARAVLASTGGAQAAYLLGRIARFRGDWAAMERHFAKVDDPALAADLRMERAHRLWRAGDFAALGKALAGFPADSARASEARYFEGLALFHSGEKEKALDTWKSLVTGCPQDPWVYRADWAYSGATQKGGRTVFRSGERGSLLGRIGYMGRTNPDLAGPPRD